MTNAKPVKPMGNKASGIAGKVRVSAPPSKGIGDDNMDAHADMHTLMRAHEIKSDPKRHAAAKSVAKTKLSQMKAVSNDTGYVGPDNKEASGNEGV